MRRLDRLHLEFPFAGSRMLRGLLAAEGLQDRPPACQNADAAAGGLLSASRRWRMLWRVTASRRYSTPIRARSSRARHSPACSPTTASPSAWTAGVPGVRTCSSSAWRSVKYEEVYLRGYDSVSEARASIGRSLDFYNSRRPHSSLDGAPPDQAYFTTLPLR